MQTEGVPHIPPSQRLTRQELGGRADGIAYYTARCGFHDHQDIPSLLRAAPHSNSSDSEVDVDAAFYFLSHISIQRGRSRDLPAWRKRLFIGLAGVAASPAEYFCLPADRIVMMTFHIEL